MTPPLPPPNLLNVERTADGIQFQVAGAVIAREAIVPVSRETALNLAAWLVAVASVGVFARPDGELEFTTDRQFTDRQFAELLSRIRATAT